MEQKSRDAHGPCGAGGGEGRGDDSRRLRCCVIGAGPSGLAVAKALLDQRDHVDDVNIEVVVFEQSDQVGGNWVYRGDRDDPYFHNSPCYASLHTNTPRDTTAFSDMPMPKTYPHFPHHRQVLTYLQDYADRFALLDHVRFRTRVVQARPLSTSVSSLYTAPGPPAPTTATSPAPSTVMSLVSSILTSLRLPSGNEEPQQTAPPPPPPLFDYDRPLSTSPSRFSPDDPRTPRWEVTYERGGEISTETFDAIAVCNGHHWSPIPLPFDVSRCRAQVLHSHEYREPSFCAGKRVAVIGMGASGTDITEEVLSVCSKLISCSSRWEEYAKRVRSIDTLKNFFPFLNDPRSSTRGIPVRAAGSHLYFADGSKEEVDVIIYCTGYRLQFPFLDESLISARCMSAARPTSQYLPLYKFLFLPHALSIAFFAVMNINGSLHPIAEAQGKLYARFLTGQCSLPSEEEMVGEVQRWYEMMHRAQRTYRVMEVDPAPYIQSLRRLDPHWADDDAPDLASDPVVGWEIET